MIKKGKTHTNDNRLRSSHCAVFRYRCNPESKLWRREGVSIVLHAQQKWGGSRTRIKVWTLTVIHLPNNNVCSCASNLKQYLVEECIRAQQKVSEPHERSVDRKWRLTDRDKQNVRHIQRELCKTGTISFLLQMALNVSQSMHICVIHNRCMLVQVRVYFLLPCKYAYVFGRSDTLQIRRVRSANTRAILESYYWPNMW